MTATPIVTVIRLEKTCSDCGRVMIVHETYENGLLREITTEADGEATCYLPRLMKNRWPSSVRCLCGLKCRLERFKVIEGGR